MHSYAGKVLIADLTRRRFEEYPLDDDLARRHLGGKGLASVFLHRFTRRGVDPFSADNALVFMTGPLSGMPPTMRVHVRPPSRVR